MVDLAAEAPAGGRRGRELEQSPSTCVASSNVAVKPPGKIAAAARSRA